MARQRFSGTFGTLLHTTLSQVEHLKESATRAAKNQREQLAIQLIERKRSAKLAALGARVMMRPEARDLAAGDPEIAAIMAEIADLDDRLAATADSGPTSAPAAVQKKSGVWRPPDIATPRGDDDDDLERYMVDGDIADK